MASTNISMGPITQFNNKETPNTLVFLKTSFNLSYLTLVKGGYIISIRPIASGILVVPVENELMKAEALINLGGATLNAGLMSIDAVRTYQGSGLAPLAGTIITQANAREELRLERRTALAFRGLAFYDARRIGYIYSVANGGGRTKCVVYTSAGVVNTNATMNYNFLDYWDVPDDEIYINPPAPGSAPTKNPL